MKLGLRPARARGPWIGVFLVAFSLLACEKAVTVNTNNTLGAGGDSGFDDPDDVPDDVLAISGVVKDADDGDAIPDVLVTALTAQVFTNGQGQYLFDASGFPGLAEQVDTTLRITATKSGYRQDFATVLVRARHNRDVDIVLTRASDTHRILLQPELLDFGDDTETLQVGIKIDETTEVDSTYGVNIPPQARAWLSVGDGQQSGTVSSTRTSYVDFTVDRGSLSQSTQTEVVIAVGASEKVLTVKALP